MGRHWPKYFVAETGNLVFYGGEQSAVAMGACKLTRTFQSMRRADISPA